MDEKSDSPEKIKVVDRRRFTPDGKLREDWSPEPAAKAPQAPPAASGPGSRRSGPADEPKTATGPKGAASVDAPLFLELVATLAQQAEMLLLGAPGLSKQPQQAKRLIDYLGVLESKTEGNLTAEERQILSNAIFQLRTAYVQQQGP